MATETADATAPQKPRKRGRGADPEQTKSELIEAATRSLIEDGFRGTTARSIANRADCNQAAIYYHFGGIEDLLIAALTRSSAERLERYEAAVDDDHTLVEVVETIERLYKDDVASGHMALLTELVGGITASPNIRSGIEATTEPWIDFVEARVRHASEHVDFGALLPAADIADLVFSIVVGVELRNRLDGRDDRADRLFRIAKLAAAMATQTNGDAVT